MSDSATPWAIAYQVPPSMEFSRQEYRSGLPFPSPGDLPNPGIEPASPRSLVLAGGFVTTGKYHLGSPLKILHAAIGKILILSIDWFLLLQCSKVAPWLEEAML